MSQSATVLVNQPRNFVSLTRAELRALAPSADLDSAPGPSKAAWPTIVAALAAVVQELECPPSFRRGGGFAVTTDVDLGIGTERLITDLWFAATSTPTLDLTTGELVDDHRWLAQAWRVAPDQALPVHLTVLAELPERDRLSENFASHVREQAAAALAALPTEALWRSPLASAALYEATRPETPDVPPVAWSRLFPRRRASHAA